MDSESQKQSKNTAERQHMVQRAAIASRRMQVALTWLHPGYISVRTTKSS